MLVNVNISLYSIRFWLYMDFNCPFGPLRNTHTYLSNLYTPVSNRKVAFSEYKSERTIKEYVHELSMSQKNIAVFCDSQCYNVSRYIR